MSGGQTPKMDQSILIAVSGRGSLTLKGKWNAESPLCLPVENTAECPRGDELADDPAQVDVSRQVWSKCDGHDFGSVLTDQR